MSDSPFNELVERIRSEKPGLIVPGFDPLNGNEKARFLFVLEAPGPKAVATNVISFDNPDPTAENFRAQLKDAGVARNELALWNVVPWYLGNKEGKKIRGAKASDVKLGLNYLLEVIAAMTKLQCVVLVGGAARRAHIHLSHQTTARILSCHHPSPKVQNTVYGAAAENTSVFRFMLETSE
jgi:uracil-DNA glycosylase